MTALVLLRKCEHFELLPSTVRQACVVLPLTPEVEQWVTQANVPHILLSSLLPSGRWEQWQREIAEELQSRIQSEQEPQLKINLFRVFTSLWAFRLSYELGKLLAQHNTFSHCFAFTGPMEPIAAPSAKDVARDNQLEWTIVNVLKQSGVETTVMPPPDRTKPWLQRGLKERILDEFPLRRWPALMLGTIQTLLEYLVAPLKREGSRKDILLVSGVELATAKREAELLQRDRPLWVVTMALGKDGDRALRPGEKIIRHLAIISIFFSKRRRRIQQKARKIEQALTAVVGKEVAAANPLWLQLQSTDVATYYDFQQRLFVAPLKAWLRRAGSKRVFLTDPLNAVARDVALWARQHKISTVCLPHGGWFRVAYSGIYNPYDQVGVWGKFMEEKIRASGYRGEIFKVPREIVDQGKRPLPPMLKKKPGDAPRLLFISTVVQTIKPMSFPSLTNFRRAVEIACEAAKRTSAELLVKCHPRFDNFAYYGILEKEGRLRVLPGETSLDEALRNADVGICYVHYTTAMIRAMEMHLPLVMVDTTELGPLLEQLTPAAHLHVVRSEEQLVETLQDLTGEKRSAFREQLLARQDAFIEFYFERQVR